MKTALSLTAVSYPREGSLIYVHNLQNPQELSRQMLT